MRTICVVVCLLVGVLPATADDTYTPVELKALDRALHAANMTREDLSFKKDITKGHGTLPVVREMLDDPLQIAVVLDGLAAEKPSVPAIVNGAAELLGVAWAPSPPPLYDAASISDTTLEVLLGWQQVLKSTHEAIAMPSEVRALRLALPPAMAWHDVFSSPFDKYTTDDLEASAEDQADDWLHARANEVDLQQLVALWHTQLADFGLASLPYLEAAFPTDKPVVVETPFGRIGLGTWGDDTYWGDFAVLIDPAGDDTYRNCRIGAAHGKGNGRVGFFADLDGDDVYDCADVNFTLGAAILGIAVFCDLGQGDDRYRGGHASLGAAMGGVAVFYDDGGADVYEGRTFTQGAAGFGIGIFHDDAVHAKPDVPTDKETPDPIDLGTFDNDRLSAWSNAQAFARCRGIALCINTRGNEIYEAGGVYLNAPLFSDRYQSFSQGFAIGQRNIDYAGGLAALIDHDGNDRYLGDIYNQGVGYWYGAGLLYDGGGNDTYEMTQYGQGSGIHLAVGGLVDVSGHDTYVMHSGLGQGSSHDYAASILHDRGGNDRYLGNTSCNGAALTNSVGIHIDRAGNDTYAGRRKGSINFGRPARGFDSIGVLLDLAGTDDYLGIMEDDTLWRHTRIGVGWDTAPEPEAEAPGGVTPAAGQPSGEAEVPAICAFEGELDQAVFDELWAIAVRWEVGDNRYIVPKARERLIAFGPDVLPYLDAVLEESASGLELRAYVDILKALGKAGHEAGVVGLLRRNFAHEVERRQRIALYLTGELGVVELEANVVALLDTDAAGLPRRAAGVLQQLKSHAGDAVLKTWLDRERSELEIQAALGTLLGLEGEVYADVRPLLDHPLLSVRSRLVQLLVDHAAAYLDPVKADLMAGDISERARRTILEVLVRTVPTPDAADALAVAVLFEHPDWGMRADAVRLLRAWEDDDTIDRDVLAPALSALARLRETEEDPYVRFCLER